MSLVRNSVATMPKTSINRYLHLISYWFEARI